MDRVVVPLMDIQSNWDEVIRQPQCKLWVSCGIKGDKAIHGFLCQRNSDAFSVTSQGMHCITIECSAMKTVTTFVSPLKTFQLHNKMLHDMDVSSSGAFGVCASENGMLWIWDSDTGETRRLLEGHVMDVETCRFFPSGVVVLSGGMDMRLKIWSAQDGSCPRTLTGHIGAITGTAMIDKGRNIISVSRDGTARLWDCGSGQCVTTVADTHSPINSCSLATCLQSCDMSHGDPPDPECGTNSKVLLVACDDGTAQAYDIRNRNLASRLINPNHIATSRCSFVDTDYVLCGYRNGGVMLFDLRRAGDPVKDISLSAAGVCSLLYLGEDRVITGHADGMCICWNIHNPSLPMVRLTGPDLDHVTSVRKAGPHVYCSCRDGALRTYRLSDLIV